MVRAGASDDLLNAIEKNLCSDLIIFYPKNGDQVGSDVRVEGRSKNISDKFLWLFAHREDLSDKWWPQGGVIKVKPDGKWVGAVNAGIEKDIGFDFEIVAIWVDSTTHKILESYLEENEKTQKYPALKLPDGSPMTKLIVRKVSH